MQLTSNYKTREIIDDTILLEFPNGSIRTDGRFIWVNVGKIQPPYGSEEIDNCILRIDGLDKVHTSVVNVRTFFKPGFIDVKIGERVQ